MSGIITFYNNKLADSKWTEANANNLKRAHILRADWFFVSLLLFIIIIVQYDLFHTQRKRDNFIINIFILCVNKRERFSVDAKTIRPIHTAHTLHLYTSSMSSTLSTETSAIVFQFINGERSRVSRRISIVFSYSFTHVDSSSHSSSMRCNINNNNNNKCLVECVYCNYYY